MSCIKHMPDLSHNINLSCNRIFNVGYGEPITKNEIGKEIANLSGVNLIYNNDNWLDYNKYLDIENINKYIKYYLDCLVEVRNATTLWARELVSFKK